VRTTLGAVLIAIGLFGIVAGVVAINTFPVDEVDSTDAVDQSLAASEQALVAAADTVGIVEGLLDQLAGALVEAEETGLNVTGALDRSEEALRQIARISGEDLPEVIESLQETMPSLIQVANVIDGTLGALSRIGVPYDPEVPFDDALEGVQEAIADLPAQVRTQADLIDGAADDLARIGDDAGDLFVELGTVRTQLEDAAVLLGNYRQETLAAGREVAAMRDDLAARTTAPQDASERTAVVVLGIAFILGQAVPIYLGWTMVRRT
jgi:hypothetical protein